tara:strand:+ start:95 stop:355 length:261 start_codon:yes stop_codon:yes gene_type:complete
MKKTLWIVIISIILSSNAFSASRIKVNYESYTAVSFNEIFNNNYSSKKVTLSGNLYLPKKEGKFPVVYIQHGTGPAKNKKKYIKRL